MNFMELKTRVQMRLGDPSGMRFSDVLVEQAVRQTLDAYSLALPRHLECETQVTVDGAVQEVPTTGGVLNVIRVEYPAGFDRPDVWMVTSAAGLTLTFGGRPFPQMGSRLRVEYTAAHALAGLNGEEDSTVNPAHEQLLSEGAAAAACLLRAAVLAEIPNRRAEELEHLTAQGREGWLGYMGVLAAIRRTACPAQPLPAAGWGTAGELCVR